MTLNENLKAKGTNKHQYFYKIIINKQEKEKKKKK